MITKFKIAAAEAPQPPEAPVYYSNTEASSWQSGWETGWECAAAELERVRQQLEGELQNGHTLFRKLVGAQASEARLLAALKQTVWRFHHGILIDVSEAEAAIAAAEKEGKYDY